MPSTTAAFDAFESLSMCPACERANTQDWYGQVNMTVSQLLDGLPPRLEIDTGRSRVWLARCNNLHCGQLSYWLRTRDLQDEYLWLDPRFVAFHYDLRQPPDEGLNEDEADLYRQATTVASASPRAACALLRVLLEIFLRREITSRGHDVGRKRLVELIEFAVEHLNLSATLRNGLSAIRVQGNQAVHDAYGISQPANEDTVHWLFVAIEDLVDDLYVKPQKWVPLTDTSPPVPEEEPF